MGEVAKALNVPTPSGNVSFYNESPTGAVDPTPTIGMIGLPSAWAQNQPAATLASADAVSSVVVKGTYNNAVGTSTAASEGTVTSKLIQSRPTLRPAEVLEFVPGVIVSQHSGDGKANQYYLRGFNLDHGTDFATFLDGMPVNMPTHAHGQGYSDLNFLIPELVQAIHYRKGLYAADDGDFSSAGTARIQLMDQLPGSSTGANGAMGSLTLGGNGYARALVARNAELTTGKLLAAIEAGHNDGPWTQPEHFKRYNGLLRYSLNEGGTKQSLTLMAYTARWDSTDQVPQRAVNSGQIGRFEPHAQPVAHERMIVDEKSEALVLNASVQDVSATLQQDRVLHRTIAAVTDDVERMAFNTAIAKLIECNNHLTKLGGCPADVADTLVLMLAPLAPHMAEELWARRTIEEPLVLLPPNEAISKVFMAELKRRRIRWRPTIEASSLELITRYVERGYGLGVNVGMREVVGSDDWNAD